MCGVFRSVQIHFNSKAHSSALQTYKHGADENVWIKDRNTVTAMRSKKTEWVGHLAHIDRQQTSTRLHGVIAQTTALFKSYFYLELVGLSVHFCSTIFRRSVACGMEQIPSAS
jgi:hypothetical protein